MLTQFFQMTIIYACTAFALAQSASISFVASIFIILRVACHLLHDQHALMFKSRDTKYNSIIYSVRFYGRALSVTLESLATSSEVLTLIRLRISVLSLPLITTHTHTQGHKPCTMHCVRVYLIADT